MRRVHKHRGVAMVTAIAMLAIVAGALTAAMAEFTAAARRTRYESAAAQLRQMQIASAISAKQKLASGPITAGQRWEIALPGPLLEQQAKLTLIADKITSDSAIFTAQAALDRRRMNQQFSFTKLNDAWVAAGIQSQ